VKKLCDVIYERPCNNNDKTFTLGVKVLLYERSPRMGVNRSPWAIKKLNKSHSKGDIANRLELEAKILSGLKHPNIIGKNYTSFRKTH